MSLILPNFKSLAKKQTHHRVKIRLIRGYRHKQANRLAGERHQKKNKAIKLTEFVIFLHAFNADNYYTA
jgi:hypothetical protein